MEKLPNFVLKLSLEEMALRRIAISLYSEPRILSLIAMLNARDFGYPSGIFFGTERDRDFFSGYWYKTVEDNMLKLKLPKFACEQMKPILKAVALELLAWKSIHEEFLGEPIAMRPACLQKLCWSTVGTLDYKRTAEEIVRCNVMNIVQSFDLACIYCLEDYIPVLWKELPDCKKKTFCGSPVGTPTLQLLLPYIFRSHYKNSRNICFPVSNPFEEAAFSGNRTIAEYCFRNLAEEEREASLVRSAKYLIIHRNERFAYVRDFEKDKLSDVICYLLSLMTPEVQLGIFKDLPCEVLRCFLDWPWQDLFADVAKVIFTFLPKSKYHSLHQTVGSNLFCSGYYFPSVFQNWFLFCPVEIRKIMIEDGIKYGLYFLEFFKNEDMETVKVILRNVDAADRVRLVFSDTGLQLIEQWTHKWHLVEQFLSAAALSEEDKKSLKDSFVKFARKREPVYDLLKEKYRRFFEFVDGSNTSAENKSLEDEMLAKTKELCWEKEENSIE